MRQGLLMTEKGFRFGLLLQVAIGPVSLFIFQLSNQGGFLPALAGVLAVTLVDAAFILAAILGMTAFLENQRVKRVFLGFGGLIIAVFGINTITEVFGWGFLPSLPIARGSLYYGTFVQGLIITAANPMTILFWAGVFATKVAEEAWSRADIYRFGLGAVISTIVCQTLIAAIGSFSHQFLERTIIDALNVAVGGLLIYFAVRLIKKGRGVRQEEIVCKKS